MVKKYFYWCLSRNLTFMSSEIYHILIAYTHYFQQIMIICFFKEKGKKPKVFNIKQQRNNDEEKGNSSEVSTSGHSSTEICQ